MPQSDKYQMTDNSASIAKKHRSAGCLNSINPLQIYPKRKPEPSIGQRQRLSPFDIEEIKYLYDCGEYLDNNHCVTIICKSRNK